MASIIQVDNETEHSTRRTTKDGRILTYDLKVIQQPERARACGSGAKSSADRRPVDPPPVCELKIFEGEGDSKTDITFSHSANFFLFTTLENARPIAKGRMPPQSSPSIPVLTGSPVAGMAYLDRPSPAGYFIFPDLSVRHEGLYRLSFSLYEELKESKDGDDEPQGSPKAKDALLNSHPMAPRAHVHFRLEVKSTPFHVFSAKKFPGLAESTPLSRTVAEQGCRVRIRRDVRMRRRDKANDGYEAEEESNGRYPNTADPYSTPQQEPDRARSLSNVSLDGQTPYSNGRNSVHDAGYFQTNQTNYTQPVYPPQPNYQQPPPPVPVQSGNPYGSGSHLNFGGPTTPQYATPQMPLQPSVNQPQISYMQSNNGWQSSSGFHSRQTSMPQTYQTHPQTIQQYSPYTPSPAYENQTYQSQMAESRRASTSDYPNNYAQNVNMNDYTHSSTALQHSYQRQQSQPYGSRTTTPVNSSGQMPAHLPPLQTSVGSIKSESKNESYETRSSNTMIPRHIEPSPSYQTEYSSLPTSAYPTSANQPSSAVAPQSQKRAFDRVFDDSHLNQPMFSGQRPSSADGGKDRTQIITDDGQSEDMYDPATIRSSVLRYKRADGRTQTKKCHSPIVPHQNGPR